MSDLPEIHNQTSELLRAISELESEMQEIEDEGGLVTRGMEDELEAMYEELNGGPQ